MCSVHVSRRRRVNSDQLFIGVRHVMLLSELSSFSTLLDMYNDLCLAGLPAMQTEMSSFNLFFDPFTVEVMIPKRLSELLLNLVTTV